MSDKTELKTLKDVVCDPDSESSCCDSGELRDAAQEWITYFESQVTRYNDKLNATQDRLERDSCRLNIYALKLARTSFIKFFNLEGP